MVQPQCQAEFHPKEDRSILFSAQILWRPLHDHSGTVKDLYMMSSKKLNSEIVLYCSSALIDIVVTVGQRRLRQKKVQTWI